MNNTPQFHLGIKPEALPKYIGYTFQWMRPAPWGGGEWFSDNVKLVNVTERRAVVELADKNGKIVRRAIGKNLTLPQDQVLDLDDTWVGKGWIS